MGAGTHRVAVLARALYSEFAYRHAQHQSYGSSIANPNGDDAKIGKRLHRHPETWDLNNVTTSWARD